MKITTLPTGYKMVRAFRGRMCYGSVWPSDTPNSVIAEDVKAGKAEFLPFDESKGEFDMESEAVSVEYDFNEDGIIQSESEMDDGNIFEDVFEKGVMTEALPDEVKTKVAAKQGETPTIAPKNAPDEPVDVATEEGTDKPIAPPEPSGLPSPEQGEQEAIGGPDEEKPEPEPEPITAEEIPSDVVKSGIKLRDEVIKEFDGQLPSKIADVMAVISKVYPEVKNTEANRKAIFKIPNVAQDVVDFKQLEDNVGVEALWGTVAERVGKIQHPTETTANMDDVEKGLEAVANESVARFWELLEGTEFKATKTSKAKRPKHAKQNRGDKRSTRTGNFSSHDKAVS